MAGPWEQFKSPAAGPWDAFKPSKPVAPALPAKPTQRTVGEAVTDTGRALAAGVGDVIGAGGTLYGLATGKLDNAATEFGQSVGDYWTAGQSDALKQQEQARSEKVRAVEGEGIVPELKRAGVAAWETLTKPALLSSGVARTIPMLIPGAGAGRVVGAGAKALGASTAAQGATALGTSIGTGAGLMGADVAGQVGETASQVPDEVWAQNPEFQKRVQAGETPEAAKQALTLGAARDAFLPAVGLSAVSQVIPGAPILERALLGGAARGTLSGSRLAGAGKAALGEGAQEFVEEGGGRVLGNVAVQQNIDPNQSAFEGSGEAGGIGAVVGAGLGAPAGALQAPPRPKGPIESAVDDVRATVLVRPVPAQPTTPPAAFPEAKPGSIADAANAVQTQPLPNFDPTTGEVLADQQGPDPVAVREAVKAALADGRTEAPELLQQFPGLKPKQLQTMTKQVRKERTRLLKEMTGEVQTVGGQDGSIVVAVTRPDGEVPISRSFATQPEAETFKKFLLKNGPGLTEATQASLFAAPQPRQAIEAQPPRSPATGTPAAAQQPDTVPTDPGQVGQVAPSVQPDSSSEPTVSSKAPLYAEEVSDEEASSLSSRNRTPPAVPGDTWDTAKVLREKKAGESVPVNDTQWTKTPKGQWTDGTRTLTSENLARVFDNAEDTLEGETVRPAPALASPDLAYDDSPELLDDDITPPSGSPFEYRDAAESTAKRTGNNAKVFELEDGTFVVRTPKESSDGRGRVAAPMAERREEGVAAVVEGGTAQPEADRGQGQLGAETAAPDAAPAAAPETGGAVTNTEGVLNRAKSNKARNGGAPNVQAVAERQKQVPESARPELSKLRGEGDQAAPGVDGELSSVPGGGGAETIDAAQPRQDRQQRGLRSGQRALADETGAGTQPAEESSADAQRGNQNNGGVGRDNRSLPVDDSLQGDTRRDDGQRGDNNPVEDGKDPVAAAAAEAATSPQNDLPDPSPAQRAAGNFKVGRFKFAGLDVSIQYPPGVKRKAEHTKPLTRAYGHFLGTVGRDKAQVDVFLGERADDQTLPVFVIDQRKPDGKGFDESKVILGEATAADARAAYLSNYPKGWKGLGAVTQMTQEQFKAWVKDPEATKRPASSAKIAAAPKESAIDKALKSVGIDGSQPADKSTELRKKADKLTKEAMEIMGRIPAGQPVQSPRDRNLRARAAEKQREASRLTALAEQAKTPAAAAVPAATQEEKTKNESFKALTEQQKADGVVATKGSPDAKGERKFYVTMIRDSKVAYLAGPFDTKPEAEAMVERARVVAEDLDDRATFDAFGVSAVTSEAHKPGKLNDQLGIGAEVAAREQPAPSKPAEKAPDRDRFEVSRVEDNKAETIEFKRGEKVKVSGSYPMTEGVIEGISHADGKFKVGASWLPFGYAYKASYDEYAAPRAEIDALLDRIEKRLEAGNWVENADMMRDAVENSRTGTITPGQRERIAALKQATTAAQSKFETEEAKRKEKPATAPAAPAPTVDPVRMTMAEWKAIPKDFKGITDGQRTMMKDGRLVPVEIIKVAKTPDWLASTGYAIGDTFTVTKDFDYLTAGVEMRIESAGKDSVNVRRTKGESGTFLKTWQWKQAVKEGWVEKVAAPEAATPPVTTATESAESDPSTLDGQLSIMQRLADGTLSVAEYQAGFAALRANRAKIEAELGKLTKDKLVPMNGQSARMSDPKDRLVRGAYNDLVTDYNLASSFSWVMGTSIEDTMQRKVDETTEAQLQDYAAKVAAAREARAARVEKAAEAIKDPKTYEDYATYINAQRAAGKTFKEARDSLTIEQRIQLDKLMAEKSRAERHKLKTDRKTEVRVAGQLTTGEVIETKHTKKGHDLFVVQLADRVSREDYDTLNTSAKRLGGNYSSYRGGGAVPGFQFRTREAADAFQALVAGDTSAAKEVAQARRDAFEDDKAQSAVERLREMADRLDERADESLGRERMANTERRARFAANAEAAANADKAMAATMRNIASAIESGDADMLDQVRTKTQVEFLRSALARAKDSQLLTKYKNTPNGYEINRGEAPDAETVEFVEWPTYTLFRSDWAQLGRQLSNTIGSKMLGQKILKLADDVTAAFEKFAKKPENYLKLSTFSTRDGKRPAFSTESQAEESIMRSGYRGRAIPFKIGRGDYTIIMSPKEAKERGLWTGDDDQRITLPASLGAEVVEKIGKANRRANRNDKINMPWAVEAAHERLSMLSRMGIETPAEFRTAVREFQALRQAPPAEDRVKKLERAMVGKKNDGFDFFPTSRAVIDEMLAAAEIEEGMSVLEPSAGMGHIADAIRDEGVEPEIVEIAQDRRELLEAKGYTLAGRDFMDIKDAAYDRIVMNPPFSNRRDAEHVRHAYNLLKPGGRLVAIMGEGVFFGRDKKATEFRAWLDSVDGTSEKLPDGSFLDPSLPVNTGVNARMVVIDKPDTGAFSLPEQTGKTGGLPFRPLQQAINAVAAQWKGDAPTARVVESARDLPDAAKRGQGWETAEGWYDGSSTVYLVAGNLSSQKRAMQVLAHEAFGHYGVEQVLGQDQWNQIVEAIARLRANPKASAKIKAALASLDSRYKDEKDPVTLAREGIAIMAEQNVGASIMDRVITAVRGWLRRLGFDVKLWSESELRALVSEGMRRVKDAAPQARASTAMAAAGQPLFSKREITESDREAQMRARRQLRGVQADMTAERIAEAIEAQEKIKARLKDLKPIAKPSATKAPTFNEGQEVGAFWRALNDGKGLALFGLPPAGETDLQKIADAIAPGYTFTQGMKRDGVQHWTLTTPSGKKGRFEVGPKGVLQLHIGDLEAGEGEGRALYMAFNTWAARNGYRAEPDRNGLTPINAYRRTEMMQSSALRDGGTAHLVPDDTQRLEHWRLGDFNNRPTEAEQLFNTGYLFVKGAAQALNTVPLLDRVQFNFETRRFEDTKGREFTDADFDALLSQLPAGKLGVGRRTAKRAVLTASVMPRIHGRGLDRSRIAGNELLADGAGLGSELQGDDAAGPVVPAPLRGGAYSRPETPDQSAAANKDAFSRPAGEILDRLDALPSKASKSLLDRIKDKIEDWRPAWLGALTLRHLAELGQGYLPHIRHYSDLVQQIDTDRNVLQEEGGLLAEKWRDLAHKDAASRKANEDMVSLMHDATIEGVDPSEVYEDLTFKAGGVTLEATRKNIKDAVKMIREQMKGRSGDDKGPMLDRIKMIKGLPKRNERRQKAHKTLTERYEALPPQFKQLFQEVRDLYETRRNQREEALIRRIEDLKMDGERKKALQESVRQQFEASRVEGVYFPLQRFGDFWVAAESPEGEATYLMRENYREWKEAIRVLHEDGFKITATGRKGDRSPTTQGVSASFVTDVIQKLGEARVSDQLKDEIYQLYLQTLPDLSQRKHAIHRKKVAGFSEDAIRAFGTNQLHDGHQISRMRYSHQLASLLELMGDSINHMRQADNADPKKIAAADALHTEFQKRHEWIMNPRDSKLSNMISSLGFAWYLGLTPAAALVNMTQPAIVTFPALAAKYGVGPAMTELVRSMHESLRTGAHIQHTLKDPDELAAHAELRRMGAIDKTQAHNLAGIAEGEDAKWNPLWAKGMRIISVLFHKAEIVNRETTGMAAYRLARKAGVSHEKAVQEAVDSIWNTQFDYCVDTETECLTTEGWKRYSDLKIGDVAATVGGSGELRLSPVSAVNIFPGPKTVTQFAAGRRFSMALTSEHEMIVQRYDSRPKQWTKLLKVPVSKVRNHHHVLRAPLIEYRRPDVTADTAFAALLGWVAAEGQYANFRNCTNRSNVRLAQSAHHNPEYVEEIRRALGLLGADWKEFYARQGEMVVWTLKGDLRKRVLKALPGKLLHFGLLTALEPAEQMALLDAFCKGDGSRRNGGAWTVVQKTSTNALNLDVLQAIATMNGLVATVRPSAKTDLSTLLIAAPGQSTLSHVKSLKRTQATVDTVWCPTTDTGTWIARRGGAVFVTGNSNSNRARFMQSNAAKTLLMFRQYSLNMTWFLARNLWNATRNEDPAIKKQARRTLTGVLGMTSLFAGTLGLPLMSVTLGVINAIAASVGDDDEPFDAEAEFRNFLADHFGTGVGEALATGPISSITGAFVANRVSLSELWFRDSERELEGRDAFAHWLEQIAGPMGGLVKGLFVGKQLVDEGHIYRGVETMLPKAVKDAMKAYRFATEGTNTLRGDPIVEELTLFETILQGSGLSPTRVAKQYEINNVAKRFEQAVFERRQRLMDSFALAMRMEDRELEVTTIEKIVKFNEKYPELAISNKGLRQSIRNRVRFTDQAEGGIVINRKIAGKAQELTRFGG